MLAFLVFLSSLFQIQGPSTPIVPAPGKSVVVADSVPNKILRVNRVIILGNKTTRDRIILRELSLKPGDTISSNRFDNQLVRDRAKVYNLRLFNTVVVRWLEFDPFAGSIDIIVEVSERWYIFPQPIFELSDRNFNEWWQNYGHDWKRVNYGLRLYHTNFRGRNEKLRFTTQFGFTRKFLLSYSIPNLGLNQKSGLIFDLSYEEPKNLAYFTEDHKLKYQEGRTTLKKQLAGAISYSFRKSFYETHALTFEYQDSRVADTIAILNPNFYKEGARRQRLASISYSFNSEHRDVIAYPLKGYQFTFYTSKTGIGLGMDVNMVEANATFAKHSDLGKGFYFSNFSSAYASTPQNQPYSVYSALGYRRQFLRGYEIYVIEGPQFFLNKTTFKKRIFSHAWTLQDMPLEQFSYLPVAVYLKAYFDFGYVNNYNRYDELNINTRLSGRMLMGTGVGLDLVTMYDNVFRFEYTFTREKTNGFFFHVKKEF
ncbi:MAG TPA: BamA/TamA family outer membrane protein [Cyclobacteriaceae bacterium]|nr:BamA/TamA family outer membrane protein [Cyclobacteriaceae bacterium]